MPAAREASMHHPTAVIDPAARVHPTAWIGPYCVVGPEVTLGEETQLLSHVVIDGHTQLGRRNVVYSGACLGFAPQARSSGKGTRLVIGDDNVIREHVTIHAGSKETGTVVGSRNFLMAGSHIGHDGQVGDDVTIANQAALGGHVVVEDRAMIGGLVGVHQYCRIGKMAMVGGLTKATQDVLPYSLVDGRPARLSGVNLVGLRRNGLSSKAIADIRRAIRTIYYSGAKFREAVAGLEREFTGQPDIEHLLQFIRSSKRGVVRRSIDRTGGAAET